MRLFSYVVARDYGFAPNPFFGFCTLATCKPGIRASANVGDWVVGLTSVDDRASRGVVYAMQVAEVLTYDRYWRDTRFADKRPDLHGSLKRAYGDNIYHRAKEGGPWLQVDSHHSFEDGLPNSENVQNDTQSDKVLVATRFAYWGRSGPDVPGHLRDFEGHDLVIGRGYKNSYPETFVQTFVEWFDALHAEGDLGMPFRW
jgi:hypothetical protein